MNRLSERPPFNEAHPPLMTSIDELVEGQTELCEIGKSVVAGDNFDFVIDPAYDWQNMPTVTPKERQRRDAVKAAKLKQVEAYHVTRYRYWTRFDRVMFAEDKEFQITTSIGYETTHQRTVSESSTETFGLTLGLELSGNLFKPKPANAVASFREQMGLGGGKASSSAEFTYQLSKELRFEETDNTTYREEQSISTTETFRGGAAYYFWAINEVVHMKRKRPEQEILEPVSDIVARTGILWIDRLVFREDNPEFSREA